MPVYTFRCRNCKTKQEFILGVDESKPAACGCGGELVRVFDLPAVHFRGSGFYSTDKALYDPIHPDDYNPEED
jgi:putative FmdB family regulatory protein